MKNLIFIVCIAFLMTLSLDRAIAKSAKERLLGVWKISKTHDPQKKRTYKPKKTVTYHFHDDGELIMFDPVFRERSIWQWKLKRNLLTITSEIESTKIVGQIRFSGHDKFIMRVRLGKNKYFLWMFERM
ncbi:MAG TPA: hypothetical protein ENI73_00535 [Spirochaetes bacterium]|nr:hypothetical protein [Spirochaetota bacterium]